MVVRTVKIQKVFVEFGGDPSDDKECYKRYTSTEPFEAVWPDSEVIECIPKEVLVEKLHTFFTRPQANPTYAQLREVLGL